MSLAFLVMLLAAVAALPTGGRFSRLADNTLTGVHWLAAAATGQILGSVTGGIAYPVGLIGSAVCIGGRHRPHLVEEPPTWSALEAKPAPHNAPQ